MRFILGRDMKGHSAVAPKCAKISNQWVAIISNLAHEMGVKPVYIEHGEAARQGCSIR